MQGGSTQAVQKCTPSNSTPLTPAPAHGSAEDCLSSEDNRTRESSVLAGIEICKHQSIVVNCALVLVILHDNDSGTSLLVHSSIYPSHAEIPSHWILPYTQVRGFLHASIRSCSGVPSAGTLSYIQRAVKGRDMRMDSMRPPVLRPKVVPLRCACKRGCLNIVKHMSREPSK